MTKLKVLGASVAMALLVASPAAAQNGGFNVESQFLGTDTVQFGGFSVEDEFLFFDNGVFNNNDGNFGNGFDDDDDIFDGDDFDDDVFDD